MADFDRPREQLFRPLENRLDVWHFYMNIERGVVDEVFVEYEDIRIVLITVKVVVDAARLSACRRDHRVEDFENLFSFFRFCDNGSDYGAARPLHGIASFCLF